MCPLVGLFCIRNSISLATEPPGQGLAYAPNLSAEMMPGHHPRQFPKAAGSFIS